MTEIVCLSLVVAAGENFVGRWDDDDLHTKQHHHHHQWHIYRKRYNCFFIAHGSNYSKYYTNEHDCYRGNIANIVDTNTERCYIYVELYMTLLCVYVRTISIRATRNIKQNCLLLCFRALFNLQFV